MVSYGFNFPPKYLCLNSLDYCLPDHLLVASAHVTLPHQQPLDVHHGNSTPQTLVHSKLIIRSSHSVSLGLYLSLYLAATVIH